MIFYYVISIIVFYDSFSATINQRERYLNLIMKVEGIAINML